MQTKTTWWKKFMGDIKPLAVTDKYAISSLKISADTSKESVKKYADEMKSIFIDHKNTLPSESELFNILLKKH